MSAVFQLNKYDFIVMYQINEGNSLISTQIKGLFNE